jgi:hypothetical protein
MFYVNVNASALVFTTPRQNAYSAQNLDLGLKRDLSLQNG